MRVVNLQAGGCLKDNHLNPDLVAALDRLRLACEHSGKSVAQLFQEPFPSILAFSAQHAIPLQDLVDICQHMMRQLDRMDAQWARTQ